VTSPTLVSHLPRHDWIGIRRFTSDSARGRHAVVHDHATVALYLDGSATFWMQGSYSLRPGDLLLIPDATPHYLVDARGVRSIGVTFCLTCLPAAVREHLAGLFDAVRRGGCAKRHLDPDDRERVERLVLDLERELDGRSDDRALAIDAYVSLLTVALLRAAVGTRVRQSATANPVVAQALDFVQRRGSSGISLRDVAKHVSRSPAHVASLVKTATGVSVVGWITRARMNESRQLLLHTSDAVDVVAERLGFASASHFHRAFKRAHGMPPGEWRRVHRTVAEAPGKS
jgi:AraC-like DNA-binding protein